MTIPPLHTFNEYSAAKALAERMMLNANISDNDLAELAILSVRISRYEKDFLSGE